MEMKEVGAIIWQDLRPHDEIAMTVTLRRLPFLRLSYGRADRHALAEAGWRIGRYFAGPTRG
jgi:hypothetical protein